MSTDKIKKKASQLGYVACGIIPANSVENYSDLLDKRVASFPHSQKLYEELYELIRMPATAKTIIVCIRKYNHYKVPESLKKTIGKAFLFDVDMNGQIPYSPEYKAKAEFEAYLKLQGINVMIKEVPYRLAAAKAGLVKYGRNNFVYSPEHGSYIYLCAWVIDKVLEYDTVAENLLLSACNDNCNKCIEACPTKALSGCLSMDRGKCIAHTKNTSDEEEMRPQMGQWIYGCDDCQDACPLNRNKLCEAEDFPLLAKIEAHLQPEAILEMTEKTYLDTIFPRFWYHGTGGLGVWKYKALRSIINSGEDNNHRLIKKCLNSADALIRETAEWGCLRLGI